MIWNHTDKASLTMKQMSEKNLKNIWQRLVMKRFTLIMYIKLKGEGRSLFSKIEGDEDTIMGLPIKKIKEYLNNYK